MNFLRRSRATTPHIIAALMIAGALPARAQLAPDATSQPAPKPEAPKAPPLPITPPALAGDAPIPEYPAEELAGGLTARVVLQLDVLADGTAANAKITSPPQPDFDEAALATVPRLKFTPAKQGETPIAVRIQFAFNFAPPRKAPSQAELKPGDLPVNFTGRIRERGTRRKLAGIEVEIPALNLSAVTDAQGHFEMHGVAAGKQQVVIAAEGYERFSASEDIEADKRLEVAYLLHALQTNRLEATVEGDAERREISKTTISMEEVNRIPGTGGDALKVIEDLPGVARTSPIGGGFLIIRGSDPFDSLVFLDGLEIPLLYHFGALSSTVNPDLLAGIDYIPGNFSVAYGDMIGGLVSVKSRQLRDELHGYINANLLETSLLLEGPVPGIDGMKFSVSGRRSYVDIILNAVVPNDGNVALTAAPVYYDAQLRIDYKVPNTNHTLQFLALTSDDTLALLFKRPLDQDPGVSGGLDVETGFSQFRLKDIWRKGDFTLDTVAMFEHLVLKFGVGDTTFDLIANSLDFRTTGDYIAAPWLTVSAGLEARNIHANVSAQIPASGLVREGDPNQMNPPRPDDPPIVFNGQPFNRTSPAIFAEARLRPLPNLLITPGIRLDTYLYTDQPKPVWTLLPRITARWDLNDSLALKAGAGLYSEGARNGDASAVFGNPAILPERATQLTLGAEWKPIPGFFFSVEGFYKNLSELVVASHGSNLDLTNEGIGRIYGVEFLLRKELTENLFGWVSYTLSKSERIDLPGEQWRPFDFDQPSNLTLIASYKLPAGFQLGGRFRLISGNPDTPVLGARYLATSDTYAPIYGAPDSERLPIFHQLDVRIDKVWTFDKWILDLYLDVLNVYNHRSIEGSQYSYDYSQHSYIHGLPILPTLGAKGSF
jgi:TonB family protein